MARSKFVRQFFKRGNKIGSMAPSSRFLALKMLHHIPFDQVDCLVELGPGTGAFTPFLLEKMKPDSTLILLELNEAFHAELIARFKDPRAIILHGSATDLPHILKQYNIPNVDCVLSSLPLAIFPKPLAESILNVSRNCLRKGGHYIQFQYSLQSRKKIQGLFGNLKLGFTPWNFPPAFVYTCTK